MASSVWIAAAIANPTPGGPTLGAWRMNINFNEKWSEPELCRQMAHRHAKRLRESFAAADPGFFGRGSLVAVRPSGKGAPLRPAQMGPAMDASTTWAQRHGPQAVEALIRENPTLCPDAIRRIANRWHATENLPGWLACLSEMGPPPTDAE